MAIQIFAGVNTETPPLSALMIHSLTAQTLLRVRIKCKCKNTFAVGYILIICSLYSCKDPGGGCCYSVKAGCEVVAGPGTHVCSNIHVFVLIVLIHMFF